MTNLPISKLTLKFRAFFFKAMKQVYAKRSGSQLEKYLLKRAGINNNTDSGESKKYKTIMHVAHVILSQQ